MSRLIDVDMLKKELSKMEDEYKATLNENCNDDPFSDGVLSALFQVFKTINSQLTAYNVDKVVEQLVKNSRPWNLQEQFIMLNNAIKIVKEGGTEC